MLSESVRKDIVSYLKSAFPGLQEEVLQGIRCKQCGLPWALHQPDEEEGGEVVCHLYFETPSVGPIAHDGGDSS